MTWWPELGFHHRRRRARVVDGGEGTMAGSRVLPPKKKGPRRGRAARARPEKRRPRGHEAGDMLKRYMSWVGARRRARQWWCVRQRGKISAALWGGLEL
jgi:hypothetical protein